MSAAAHGRPGRRRLVRAMAQLLWLAAGAAGASLGWQHEQQRGVGDTVSTTHLLHPRLQHHDSSSAAGLQFHPPTLISDGQVNTSHQMAHGCDRFFNLDTRGTAIFGGGQNRIYYSTDGARTFQIGYGEPQSFPHPRTELLPAGPVSLRDFGTIYTQTKTNATSFNFSTLKYYNYSLIDGNITAQSTKVPAAKQLTFVGLPHGIRCNAFACSLRLQGTGRVTLPDKSMLQTAIVWWGGNDKYPLATSIVVFRSVDGGWRWDFRGIVANASQYANSQEGPNEHGAAILADGKTVMVLMRMDGGDGVTVSAITRSFVRQSSCIDRQALLCAAPVQDVLSHCFDRWRTALVAGAAGTWAGLRTPAAAHDGAARATAGFWGPWRARTDGRDARIPK